MSGATARPVDDSGPERSALKIRFFSAIVLAAPVLVAVHLGRPVFEIMVAFGAALLAREWIRLCGARYSRRNLAVMAVACISPVVAAAFGAYAVAAGIILGSMAIALLAGREGPWLAAGIAYIAVPCLAFVWLRSGSDGGPVVVYWLLAVVWATDVGAYACGRSIGGPRLAPALSPKKTWSGFVGGVVCGCAAGTAVAAASGASVGLLLVAASAGIGLAAQAGDLFESFLKRRFGVKDSGGLIPGHGGLFDRVDGLIAASVVTALIGLCGDGSIREWL